MSGVATTNLLDSFAPWLATDTTGALTSYLAALGSMYDTVAGIVSDSGDPDDPDYVPGWSVLLDVNNCPTEFLPYLAQFNGTSVAPGTSDAQARAMIKGEAGFNRGTGYYGVATPTNPTGAGNGAMYQAALRHLTGTQFLLFRERTAANSTPDAYHVVIGFHPSECPSVPALSAAVEAVKPAGIQITYVASNGFTWNESFNRWQQDTFSWDHAFTTQP